jgi:hypothetical protein
MIAFRNRLQTTHHDADGTHRTGDQDRGAVLLAAVKNAETQESGVWVLRSLAASPTSVPGPYRNSKPVTVHMEQRMETHDHPIGVGIERWQLQDQDGQELSMYLRCGIGIPVRTIGESKVRGGPDPTTGPHPLRQDRHIWHCKRTRAQRCRQPGAEGTLKIKKILVDTEPDTHVLETVWFPFDVE